MIERPASVVKELVENAIDAGATAIVVEIQEGGTSLIRIADNGCGIEKEEVPNAFRRHATSKIRSVEDLVHIGSLGFRGEALSSIAAVSQVELLTKTKGQVFGTRYRINGGAEVDIEDTGARDGTTFLIRQLFYNVPARRKFLKTPMTEASHVGDLMTRLALSHPEISFQFINNGQSKLHSSGNGSLRDVIYHVYGRDIASNLLKAQLEAPGMRISGFLGKPIVSRGNRNFENYFINGRYVKNQIVSKAIEDAYKDFSMQHKYPFVALLMEIDGEGVDVNVHPAKLEIRFHNQQEVYNRVFEAVSQGLHREELIPHVELDVPEGKFRKESGDDKRHEGSTSSKPLPFEGLKRTADTALADCQKSVPKPEKQTLPPPSERNLDYFMEQMQKRVMEYHSQRSSAEVADRNGLFKPELTSDRIRETVKFAKNLNETRPSAAENGAQTSKEPKAVKSGGQALDEPKQLDLFEEKLLTREAKDEYHLIGQVFETYWLVEFHEKLYIIDQHAAHERILYERTLRSMRTREFTSQMITPPIILELSMQEAELLKQFMEHFTRIGFEFEDFGQESFVVRAVPDNLFSIAKKELLLQMLDSLSDEVNRNLSPDLIDEEVASMSCKAAVKGNMRLSAAEVDALIGELLTLENPYHCPHGRPTIIAMSRRELEKKFKRIV